MDEQLFSYPDQLGLGAPMERASVAMDGDSRAATDGAKCPLEWVAQALAEQLHG